MKRPPFKILPSTQSVYRRGGRFVTAGRTSFVWETLVMAAACNVPGPHEIRRGTGPWYRIDLTVAEAEAALDPKDDAFGRRRVERARRFRSKAPWTADVERRCAELRALTTGRNLTIAERDELRTLRRIEIAEATRRRREMYR